MPVGKPWEMIVVDILQVPVSSKNNGYLQDYFTKWAETGMSVEIQLHG